MGEYYNPLDVIKVGKKLEIDLNRPPKPRKDERFIGLCDNGIYTISPDLTDTDELKHFHNQYREGWLLNIEVIAVKMADINAGKIQKGGPRANTQDLERIRKENPIPIEDRFW